MQEAKLKRRPPPPADLMSAAFPTGYASCNCHIYVYIMFFSFFVPVSSVPAGLGGPQLFKQLVNAVSVKNKENISPQIMSPAGQVITALACCIVPCSHPVAQKLARSSHQNTLIQIAAASPAGAVAAQSLLNVQDANRSPTKVLNACCPVVSCIMLCDTCGVRMALMMVI